MFENVIAADSLILVVMLAAFLIIGYKVMSVLKNVMIIAVLAAAFPFAMNYLFGAHFPTTYAAEIRYLIIALGLYLVYEALVLFAGVGGFFWSVFRMLSKPFVWLGAAVKRLLLSREKKEEKKKMEKN